MTTEIRKVVVAMLAESHLAQAESLKKRLEIHTYMDSISKEVLWATYYAHLDSAETLLQRADNA